MTDSDGNSELIADPLVRREPDTDPPDPTARGRLRRIYRIRRRSDGKAYVGVTCQTLARRLATHDTVARLRPGYGGPRSLAAAIRAADAAGFSIHAAFEIEQMAKTEDADEARRLEREWIAHLGTNAPNGFNLLPGGSLGGPANAAPLAVCHPVRGEIRFDSAAEAIDAINVERTRQGLPPLGPGTVYARLALGWIPEEALGLVRHLDGRGRRPAFLWQGRSYRSLRELGDAERLPIATVRSRLHRARRAGLGALHDVALDRRSRAARPHSPRDQDRAPPLVLPHPHIPGATVNAAEFARLVGLPRATILSRYHQLQRAGSDVRTMSREEAQAAFTALGDRRIVISLLLPSGRILRGGVRELVRRVRATPRLRRLRREPIGESAIRARLRRLPGWPDRPDPAQVARAFGYGPPE